MSPVTAESTGKEISLTLNGKKIELTYIKIEEFCSGPNKSWSLTFETIMEYAELHFQEKYFMVVSDGCSSYTGILTMLSATVHYEFMEVRLVGEGPLIKTEL